MALKQQARQQLRQQIQLHFIVFIWGFTSIIGKLTSVDFLNMVIYRTGLCVVFLLIILRVQKKKLFIAWGDMLKIIGVGMIIGVHWITFFASVQVSNVSICVVGIATVSFFTAFIEPIVKKEPLSIRDIVFGVVVVLGVAIIYGVEWAYGLGLSLSLVSSLLAAIFSSFNAKLVQKHDAMQITFYEMLGAYICAYICALLVGELTQTYIHIPIHNLSEIALFDAGLMLFLALVCTVYPFYYSTKLMEKLSAFHINLVINMEPVYGILLALLIFGEAELMTKYFYIGMLIILGSVIMYSALPKLKKS